MKKSDPYLPVGSLFSPSRRRRRRYARSAAERATSLNEEQRVLVLAPAVPGDHVQHPLVSARSDRNQVARLELLDEDDRAERVPVDGDEREPEHGRERNAPVNSSASRCEVGSSRVR